MASIVSTKSSARAIHCSAPSGEKEGGEVVVRLSQSFFGIAQKAVVMNIEGAVHHAGRAELVLHALRGLGRLSGLIQRRPGGVQHGIVGGRDGLIWISGVKYDTCRVKGSGGPVQKIFGRLFRAAGANI